MTDAQLTDLLHRLRAGLLDDRRALKAHVEQILKTDAHAQREFRAPERIIDGLNDSAERADEVNRQLRWRRRKVVGGHTPKMRRRFPVFAASTAAAAALAVGLAWLGLPERSAFVDPGTTVSAAAGSNPEVLSDLTDNLDFYVWLERQGAPRTAPGNGT